MAVKGTVDLLVETECELGGFLFYFNYLMLVWTVERSKTSDNGQFHFWLGSRNICHTGWERMSTYPINSSHIIKHMALWFVQITFYGTLENYTALGFASCNIIFQSAIESDIALTTVPYLYNIPSILCHLFVSVALRIDHILNHSVYWIYLHVHNLASLVFI